jgi:hypothetical protein
MPKSVSFHLMPLIEWPSPTADAEMPALARYFVTCLTSAASVGLFLISGFAFTERKPGFG